MSLTIKRLAALALSVVAATVGVWAAAFPASFYGEFPLPGRNWVSALGPYNEHLTRDVGGLYLGLLVVTLWAVRRPSPTAMRVTGGAWLIFNAQHFLWHSLHLGAFPLIDRIGNVVSLAAVLLLSILLLLPRRLDDAVPSHDRRTTGFVDHPHAPADEEHVGQRPNA